jgi:hypothetical protein
MQFLNIDLGNLLTIFSFIFGGIAFAYTIRTDVGLINSKLAFTTERLESMEIEIKKISEILVSMARQDERLNAMEKRIAELRRSE